MNVELNHQQRWLRRLVVGIVLFTLAGASLIGLGEVIAEPKAATHAHEQPDTSAKASSATATVERGRYLVQIGGCNDCHTPDYGQLAGQKPVDEWLTGWSVGFRGPWGTSYPSNLRLTVRGMSEEQWLSFARAPRLPPMPWFSLRDMTDEDLRSIYRFISDLGPKGERAPTAAAPGQPVSTPYFMFEPRMDQVSAANN